MTNMNTFGTIKSKLVKKLTESYVSNNKSELKEIIKTIKSDKEFRDLYLFYEDVENKYFDDPETAKLYVEQISLMLLDKKQLVENTCKILDGKLTDVITEENSVYDALDQLLDIDTLKNIDKKLNAKKKIINVITTSKKKQTVTEDVVFTGNEVLLHTVMTNNFNSYFNQSLNEEEKNELKSILTLTDEELNIKVTNLKESILEKISNIITESTNDTLVQKLNDVRMEVENTEVSKYSYYKLNSLLNESLSNL